ncbi:MAG: hypothetical protein ACT4OH_00630 [Methylophilaceae bacterium]
MKLADYLNLPLKSDEMLELFEEHNVDVIYSYDRLHEGMEDQYYGSIPSLGLQFLFNEHQLLKAIFVYTHQKGQFEAANLNDLGLIRFANKAEAIFYAEENDILWVTGEVDFLGESREWVKLLRNDYSVHYEFCGAALWLVTLQVSDA